MKVASAIKTQNVLYFYFSDYNYVFSIFNYIIHTFSRSCLLLQLKQIVSCFKISSMHVPNICCNNNCKPKCSKVFKVSRFKLMVKKRIQHGLRSLVKCTDVSIKLRAAYRVPGPPTVLKAVLIVLVAAAGGVVLIKVKLLVISERCCCHIFNLYLQFKGCQSSSMLHRFLRNSLLGCWQFLNNLGSMVQDFGINFNY